LPKRRFAHGAAVCGQFIVITSGISDLLHDMGLRSVPSGEPDCFSFNIFENEWRQLPDLPVGKMHPTLVVINNRFIFQIGGFDDFIFDIYRLDMASPEKPWQTLTLDTSQPIIDSLIYFDTSEHEARIKDQD